MNRFHKSSAWQKVLLTLLLAGTTAVLMLVVKSNSVRQLDRCKAELRAIGEKLTFEELKIPPPLKEDSLQELKEPLTEMGPLRYRPSDLRYRQYIAPGKARVIWKPSRSSTDTGIAWPKIGVEFSSHAAQFGRIRAFLANPPRRTSAGENGSEGFLALRNAAQLLAAKTISDLYEQDYESAVQSLESLAGLARVNREEFTLISHMIRVAIAELGLAVTWEALQADPLNDAQLARIQKAWQSVDLLPGLERAMVGERAFAVEGWAQVRDRSAGEPAQAPAGNRRFPLEELGVVLLSPVYRLSVADADELFYLTASQQRLEVMRRLVKGHPWPEGQSRLSEYDARTKAVFSGVRKYRYPLSGIMLPNGSKAIHKTVQAETERRLAITAVAVKRYQRKFGSPPATLNELLPAFLTAQLLDPMDGQPLKYGRSGGEPFIYSVGEDGSDDGGDPTPALTVPGSFWEAKDAVWPLPSETSIRRKD